MEFLRQPWPWYVAGPLIGLMVPALLIVGNKLLGVSSSLRHICAACIPGNVPFLKYEWKKQSWNLFFAAGIVIGGFLGGYLFADTQTGDISSETINAVAVGGVSFQQGFLPKEVFNWSNLFTLQGFLMMVVGGFLVGFGTRYAGGCTSGHGIMGLSSLQWPSLVAVVSFFSAGIMAAKYLVPFLLKL